MKQLDGTGLKRLHRAWRRRTEGRLALLLDGVANPLNVGSIARSAASFGVDHLWLAGAAVAPDVPGARKTALGTDRYLTWTAVATATEAVAAARADGYVVVGVELADRAVPLHELVDRLGPDVCLAIGHEDHGLSRACLDACDHVAFLPQVGKVGSLNVAQAATVAMYEVRRRTWLTPAAGEELDEP